jgi:trehalose-phosphatase
VSALLVDFDGTLAPFRVDPASVRPWSGVRELLERIQCAGRTTIAVVTGRPACETAPLLGIIPPPEVWGLHGAERLDAAGWLEQQTLEVEDREALAAVLELLPLADLARGVRIERKWNAITVHWRGVSARRVQATKARVMELFQQAAQTARMRCMLFDGGVELCAGRNKGDAVRLILQGLAAATPVAYLGDDETDEDAFQALEGRGLGILVRRRQRPTAAHAWLRPPGELRDFLAAWLHALVQGSRRPVAAAASDGSAAGCIESRTAGSALG